MIVIAAVLVTAIIAVVIHLGLNLYSYFLVDGIRKAVEAIEEPNLEGAEHD